MLSLPKIIKKVANTVDDFEFYPTTPEMLKVIESDINTNFEQLVRYSSNSNNLSILDIGAGNGSALSFFDNKFKKYAIEKSQPLLNELVKNKNITVLGTDLFENQLIDKPTTFMFCNPPYSEFKAWMIKIINESLCTAIYFVVPQRWKNDREIKQAIDDRNTESNREIATVIGSFDFLDAPRKARANVDIIRIQLGSKHNNGHSYVKPLENILIKESQKYKDLHAEFNTKSKAHTEIVQGNGLIEQLVNNYNANFNKLFKAYSQLMAIDDDVLSSCRIYKVSLVKKLEEKLNNLKNKYWMQLIDGLTPITSRLTSQSRQWLTDHIVRVEKMDLTYANAHYIVLWCIENSNELLEKQFIDTVERLIGKANTCRYKSNQKTISDEVWRYIKNSRHNIDRISNIKINDTLDYRIVLEGISGWTHNKENNFISPSAANFIDDLRLIAKQIGFDTDNCNSAKEITWGERAKRNIEYYDHNENKPKTLFSARLYSNTMHIQFNQSFICKINVEHGRLKGWLKSATEAARELDISEELANETYGLMFKFEVNSTMPEMGFRKKQLAETQATKLLASTEIIRELFDDWSKNKELEF